MLRVVILLLFFFNLFPVFAQQEPEQTTIIIDTITVRKNSYVVTKDSVFFAERDTVYYVADTLNSPFEEILNQEDYQEEKDFYTRLKERLSKRRATKEIFDLLFDISDGSKKPAPDPLAHIPQEFDGKVIGNIYLQKVNIFGANVIDTTGQPKSKITGFINNIHINTRDRVVRNNMMLDQGDFINQHKIADDERVLRALPFIRDARIYVKPRQGESDTVDLLVVTQDVLSISGSVDPSGLSAATVHIDDNSILGTGHQLDNAIVIRPDEEQSLGYRGLYRIPNINGSFVQANLSYINTHVENVYQFQLLREFVVPAIKYAGGVDISYNERMAYDPLVSSYSVIDTFSNGEDIPIIPYSYWHQDYWIARSLSPNQIIKNNRSRLILALRYNQTRFDTRPIVSADSNSAYHHSQLLLGKIGFSKRNYTTEQLVYTYGRTEDIPVGYLAEITAGPHIGEFYNRFYTGSSFSSGHFMKRLGYVSLFSEVGGFWRDNELEEGMFQVGLKSFSYLIHRRRTQYRLFVNANYTTGIQRMQTINFQDSYINIRDENGIRGLRSDDLNGNERLTLNLETVAYSPINIYGFRVAFFAFADIGWISQTGRQIFSSKTYQGYGMGMRVRNENLAFKTFQIRLSAYPVVPNGQNLIGFTIGNVPVPRFRDFYSSKPDLFRFH